MSHYPLEQGLARGAVNRSLVALEHGPCDLGSHVALGPAARIPALAGLPRFQILDSPALFRFHCFSLNSHCSQWTSVGIIPEANVAF